MSSSMGFKRLTFAAILIAFTQCCPKDGGGSLLEWYDYIGIGISICAAVILAGGSFWALGSMAFCDTPFYNPFKKSFRK